MKALHLACFVIGHRLIQPRIRIFADVFRHGGVVDRNTLSRLKNRQDVVFHDFRLRGALIDLLGTEISAEFLDLKIRENKNAGDRHAGQRADRVKGLREIQSACRRLGWSHREDVRIRRGFEEGQAESQDVERDQKQIKARHVRRRNADHGTGGIEGQADNDAGPVGKPADKQGGGDGHCAVAAVEGHLHPAALRVVDDKDILERRHERVRDIVGESPQGEETRDQNEGKEELARDDGMSGIQGHGGGVFGSGFDRLVGENDMLV